MLDIAIVIPCADDVRLAECLASLDEDVEVVVALNGATDEVKAIVDRFGVKRCELPKRNLGAACNAGIEAASSSSIFLMNSDCVFGKGTIRRLYTALENNLVARGRVIFESDGWISKVIAEARDYEHTKPQNVYQPALVFNKNIIEYTKYYFDKDIHWTEDADFTRRLKAARIEHIIIPDAVVYHPPLTIRQDLRSAYRYGIGQRIADEKRLIGTSIQYRPRLKEIWQEMISATRAKNVFAGLYIATLWTGAFTFGYYAQLVGDVYDVRDKIRSESTLSN